MLNPDTPKNATPEFPPLITFLVELSEDGSVIEVQGHRTEVDHGCLLIYRGIFANEECTQATVVPAGFFGAGEWVSCTTDYQGYTRPVESSIVIH